MKPSLPELNTEKNVHGAILIVLCITAFSIYGLIFSFIIFPVAGLTQLIYNFVKLGRYPESRRRLYAYVASTWLIFIVLILSGGGRRIFPDAMSDVFILGVILIIGPICLSAWIWRIARADYYIAQQDPEYPTTEAIISYDDLLDS